MSDDAHTLSIRDVAQEYAVTYRQLRFWENVGLLAPQRLGDQRWYSRADTKRVLDIIVGQRMGLTNAQIRKVLDTPPPTAPFEDRMTEEARAAALDGLRRRSAEIDDAIARLLFADSRQGRPRKAAKAV